MFRHFFLTIIACLVSSTAFPQSIDEKIGNAMNASDWFALDSIYSVTPKDSINPFLEVFSRCLIGNRLNRTDVSIPAFQELLNSHSLDMSNLISSMHMFGVDLSREGYNAEAASMINSILGQAEQYMDSATVSGLKSTANRYAALANYKPYQTMFPQSTRATIPFTIVPVGPKEKGSVLMHLQNSLINGLEAEITFDTGAGTNITSPEMAEKYQLIPLEGSRQTVVGVGKRDGYYAIAKELRMGDIVVKDVPFVVLSLSSDNEEADQYMDSFSIVVGGELMLRLKDLTIDFANRKITIPTEAPERSAARPNMCFSNGLNLLTKGTIRNVPATMCIDSGDASFGALSSYYYERDSTNIQSFGRLDTIRSAGIGGYTIMPCYILPETPVRIGGTTVEPSGLVVKTQNDGGYDVNIGLRTLMLFSRVRFNMVDFVLTTEPYAEFSSRAVTGKIVPELKYSKEKSPNILQTAGFIGVAVARGLLYPDPSVSPDL